MESMMTRVTASMARGVSAAINRHRRLATTTFGAASQTIRKSGGIFLRALSRSCHFDWGVSAACFVAFTVGFLFWTEFPERAWVTRGGSSADPRQHSLHGWGCGACEIA